MEVGPSRCDNDVTPARLTAGVVFYARPAQDQSSQHSSVDVGGASDDPLPQDKLLAAVEGGRKILFGGNRWPCC